MASVVFQLLDPIRNINPEEVLNLRIYAQCHGIRPFLCSLFFSFQLTGLTFCTYFNGGGGVVVGAQTLKSLPTSQMHPFPLP